MNVTITAHNAAEDGDIGSHRFDFIADDGACAQRGASVTHRTAQIFARELANRSGLDAMMRAIAAASPQEYDSLIGINFSDI